MTTRPKEFPESLRDSTGLGPDFPGSSGDRERGKFRPSATPRLTSTAVVGDDGRAVVWETDELLRQLLLWTKANVVGQIWTNEGISYTLDELLEEVGQ